jgi:hypothetical protein
MNKPFFTSMDAILPETIQKLFRIQLFHFLTFHFNYIFIMNLLNYSNVKIIEAIAPQIFLLTEKLCSFSSKTFSFVKISKSN